MPIEKIVPHAHNIKSIKPHEWMAQCPCHQDDKASLHITETDDGTVLLKCHAGCDNRDIVKSWGLELKDLFVVKDQDHKRERRITATYDYTDLQGKLIYQSVRYDPKDFRQRRPDGKGDYIWNLKEVESLPYRLPELIKAFDVKKMVLVVEGEKDVETLNKLGFVATCNHGGAGKWNESHNRYFPPGIKVTILPDNDEPGKKHGQVVRTQLKACGCEVHIINLPGLPDHGDVSDWLKDHSKKDLINLIVEDWEKQSEQPDQELESEVIINKHLGPVITCLDDIEIEDVNWLWYKFLASRKLTMMEGDPGDGKTFLALALTAIITNGWPFPGEDGIPNREKTREPGNVLYMTGEDGLADTIKPRLEMLGADHKKVFILEGYFSEGDSENMQSVTLTDLNILKATFEQVRPVLLVVDPLQAYLGAGVDMHRANEVRPVLSAIMRLAETFDTAIVFIRHLNKASGGKALYRGMGSIDFNAAARSVLLVGRDPEDKHKRVVIQTKSSLSDEAPVIGFNLDQYGFTWTGVSDLTAEQVLSAVKEDSGNKSAVDEAREFLGDILQDRPVASNEIFSKAKSAGISTASIRRAKEHLDIHAFKEPGKDGLWMWRLRSSNILDEHVEQVTGDPNYRGLNNVTQLAQVNSASKLHGRTAQEINHDLWADIGHVVEGRAD